MTRADYTSRLTELASQVSNLRQSSYYARWAAAVAIGGFLLVWFSIDARLDCVEHYNIVSAHTLNARQFGVIGPKHGWLLQNQRSGLRAARLMQLRDRDAIMRLIQTRFGPGASPSWARG
jgi:hypothetical protein